MKNEVWGLWKSKLFACTFFTRFESHSGILMDVHRSSFAHRQSSVILLWVCLFSCHTAWRNNDTGLNICIVLFKGTMKSLAWACTAQKSYKEAFTSRFLEGNQVVERSLLGLGEGGRAHPCWSFFGFFSCISECVPWWEWRALSCATNLNINLGISKAKCPNVTFPFPTAILSLVHCCLQQCSHLVCEQWPVLNEAVLSNSIPAALDHLRKSSVNVARTELLSAASEAEFGVAGGEICLHLQP